MPYTRGNSKNIIVGAAAFFVADAPLSTAYVAGTGNDNAYPAFATNASYRETLSNDLDFVTVGYATNGLEMTFEPDFGEVSVDQVLDVTRLFKQGMKVTIKTSFAEATLENLIIALAFNSTNVLTGTSASKLTSAGEILELSAGQLGECPVERGLIAVGPGTGDCTVSTKTERIYIAYRALSIDSVTLSAKRDEATVFEVNFRLLPEDTSGSYGKMVDRTWT